MVQTGSILLARAAYAAQMLKAKPPKELQKRGKVVVLGNGPMPVFVCHLAPPGPISSVFQNLPRSYGASLGLPEDAP